MTLSASKESQLERLYRASAARVDLVDIPVMRFLMLDGRGDPNTSDAYRDAIEALYALSYGVKFSLKKDAGLEYRVGPLEGL